MHLNLRDNKVPGKSCLRCNSDTRLIHPKLNPLYEDNVVNICEFLVS